MTRARSRALRGLIRFFALIGHASVAWAASQAAAPPNDHCDSGVLIQPSAFTDAEVTSGASVDATDPAPHCGNGSATMSVWYRFTAPQSGGTLTVDTIGSDYDTILSAWTGACGQLTAWPGGCNDDYGSAQSRITLALSAGQTVRLMVSASFADGGNLAVHASFLAPSGEVPLMSVAKAAGGDLTLSWAPSCQSTDSDTEIYQGTIGSWASHVPVACSTSGAGQATFTPLTASAYFLAVPRNASVEGSYGTTSAGSERPASASACAPRALAGCPPACALAKCATGAELSPACDSCVAGICADDPYCCEIGWDATCVSEVRTVCDNLTCADSRGVCAHGVCQAGAALVAQCDDPPVDPSCVTAVCTIDAFCCSYSWDATCIAEVGTACGASCN